MDPWPSTLGFSIEPANGQLVQYAGLLIFEQSSNSSDALGHIYIDVYIRDASM